MRQIKQEKNWKVYNNLIYRRKMMIYHSNSSETILETPAQRQKVLGPKSSYSPRSQLSSQKKIKSLQSDIIHRLKQFDIDNLVNSLSTSYGRNVDRKQNKNNNLIDCLNSKKKDVLNSRRIVFEEQDEQENTISVIKVELGAKQKKREEKKKHVELNEIYVKTKQNQILMTLNQQWRGPYFKNSHLTPLELKKLQHSKRVELSYSKYTQEQFYGIIDYHEQIEASRQIKVIQTLYLSWMKIPNIINVLNRRVFTNLKTLNIGGNNVESLQNLTKLQADRLQQLWCWNNQIVQTKSLRKCSFKNMKVLDMNSNRIIQTPGMKQLPSHNKMRRINLDSNLCVNIDGFLSLLGSNQDATISLLFNQFASILGRPSHRRRKQISSIKPALSYVHYS